MSCVLRIGAPDLKAVLDRIAMTPSRLDDDWANFVVSDAGFDDLAAQIADAIAFLRRHKDDITKIMDLPSAEGWLDFGVADRNCPAQSNRFTPELVCLAGKAGIGLEMSTYWVEAAEDTIH